MTEQVLAVETSSRPGLSGISPVLQQRHNGYAAFILHSLEDSRIDQAAVIIDLSRVGGHYYASTQPTCLQVDSFLASILCLTGVDDRDLCLWTQDSDLRPSPPEATLRLRHGDVLTVLWQGVQPAPAYQIQDLFCPDAIWGPVRHMPIRTCSQHGFLVLHPPEVSVLHRHHFPGCDLHDALCAALRQPTDALCCLSAELPDPVEHCGELCSRTVLVAGRSGVDDSGIINGNSQEINEPLPVLCDARQIGRGIRICDVAIQDDRKQAVLTSLELDADDQRFEVQFIQVAPATSSDSTMPVAVIWERTVNSPTRRQYRAASPRNPIRQLYQGNAGPAQDQEPARPDEAAGQGPNDNNRDTDDELWQAGSADESNEELDPDLLQVNFIVLRLECSPVEVQIPLRIPAGVQDALDALYLALSNDVCAAYSHLLAVRHSSSRSGVLYSPSLLGPTAKVLSSWIFADMMDVSLPLLCQNWRPLRSYAVLHMCPVMEPLQSSLMALRNRLREMRLSSPALAAAF